MKKILLTGSPFTWNYGSMALVVSTIDDINDRFPDTKFLKNSVDFKTDKKNYAKYFSEEKLKIFGFNFGKKNMLLSVPLLLIKSIPYMKKSDLVLEVSGEIPDDISVFSLLARIILAKMLRKPFIIFALSFGPYKNKITIPFLKLCINLSDKVIVRDIISYNYLKNMHISKEIHLTADQAFLFKSLSDKDSKTLLDKLKIWVDPFIIICPKAKYEIWPKYLIGLQKTINYIINKYNKNILILPHGKEDIEVSRKLYSYFKDKKNVKLIDKQLYPHEIKGLMKFSEFVISSRVHGGIASISQNIPSIFLIPLSDHRGKGILGNLYDLDDFVVDPTHSEQIIHVINKYFSNKNKILKHIKKRNEIVFSRSRENVNIISRFLD